MSKDRSIKATWAKDGFKGTYTEARNDSARAIIVLFSDDDEEAMDKGVAKWLGRYHGMNALTVAITSESGEKGLSSFPLERIEKAVGFLKAQGNRKIGIIGISMQAVVALAAASVLPDITLTIAFAPADYVPWGFRQGRLGKWNDAEWPTGKSLLSYNGKDLPYIPATLEGEAYYERYLRDKKKFHEIHTIGFFEDAEKKHKLTEDEAIKVEDINGPIVFVGAEDDSMWPSSAYIRRMHGRLMDKGFKHQVDAFIYEFGTHLLVPERLLYSVFPIGGGFAMRLYRSGRKHSSAIRAAREELEEKFGPIFENWL